MCIRDSRIAGDQHGPAATEETRADHRGSGADGVSLGREGIPQAGMELVATATMSATARPIGEMHDAEVHVDQGQPQERQGRVVAGQGAVAEALEDRAGTSNVEPDSRLFLLGGCCLLYTSRCV